MLINKTVGILNFSFRQVLSGFLLKKIMNKIIMISKKNKNSEIINSFSQCTGGAVLKSRPDRASGLENWRVRMLLLSELACG